MTPTTTSPAVPSAARDGRPPSDRRRTRRARLGGLVLLAAAGLGVAYWAKSKDGAVTPVPAEPSLAPTEPATGASSPATPEGRAAGSGGLKVGPGPSVPAPKEGGVPSASPIDLDAVEAAVKQPNGELPSTEALRALANAGRPVSHQVRDLVLARTLADVDSTFLPRDLAAWAADCCSTGNVQPIAASATSPADRLGFWWTMTGSMVPAARLLSALRRTNELPDLLAEGRLRAAESMMERVRARRSKFGGAERDLLDATLEFLTIAPVSGVTGPHSAADSRAKADAAARAFVAKWSTSADDAVRRMVKWASVRYGV